MKTKIFFITICFTVFCIHAQNKKADSLISLLKETKIETKRLELLNTISSVYKTTSGTEVLNYGKKALDLAIQLNNKTEQAHAYANLGIGNIILGNYDKSVDYFTDAKIIFESEYNKNQSIDLKKSIARTYGYIGIVYSEQSNYALAFKNYIKAINVYEELEDKGMLSSLYNNVAVAYKSQGEYKKALYYFSKAKTIQLELDDSNIGITLTNSANCHLKLEAFPQALSLFNEAKPHVKQNPRALGEWHNSIGTYYYKTNAFEKAKSHWNEAIIAFKSMDDKFGIADTYIFKSKLFLEQKNYSEAIKNALQALDLANQTEVLEQQRNAQQLLSQAFEKQNNLPKAFQHYKSFKTLNDSLANAENIRKGVQAQMNFEYQKKANTERLEREKHDLFIAEEAKLKTIKYIALGIGTLLLLGLGFLYYNRKQLKQRLTLEKELAEYEQKALHLQMNPHFIFNCLGAISGFIINNGTDHAIKYLSKFSKLMRLTLEYSKESLIPIGKEIESLQNYLELEKLRFNNAFDFTITKSKAIEDDVALPPLLIQPLVENAIIHGIIPNKKHGIITINFTSNNDTLYCEITDNGAGIDSSKTLKENSVQIHKSMALEIINKRLNMIGKVGNSKAHLQSNQINDKHGDSIGTTAIISLPIQYID